MAGDGKTPAPNVVANDFEFASASRRFTWPAATVVIAFALCDVAIVPVISTFSIFSPSDAKLFLILAICGAIVAQMCLLATWSVFGPGNAWKKRAVEILIGAFWLSAWAVGLLMITYRSFPDSVSSPIRDLWMGLCVPVVYLGVQAPLWPVRILLRWRIEIEARFVRQVPAPSLSLADIMWNISTIAVCLGIARGAFQIWNGLGGGGMSDLGFWVTLGSWTLAAGVASSVGTIPAVALLLRSLKLILGLSIFLGYALLAWFVIILVVALLTGLTWSQDWPEFVGMVSALPGGFIFALAAPLVWARALGFRLKWGRHVV